MPETLQFAINTQAAGSPAVARVYAGMFHDFMQYSQGCGSHEIIGAGENAFQAATDFLLHPPSFSKLGGCADDKSCDYAPVAWISNFTKRPPINQEECLV